MRNDLKYSQHTHSYLALRNAVGWIGILLPFTLMLGVFLIFKGDNYYPLGGMRDFVMDFDTIKECGDYILLNQDDWFKKCFDLFIII